MNTNKTQKKTRNPYEVDKAKLKVAYLSMDYHLLSLHDALVSGNESEVISLKKTLSDIRDQLYELRYFRYR